MPVRKIYCCTLFHHLLDSYSLMVVKHGPSRAQDAYNLIPSNGALLRETSTYELRSSSANDGVVE
ncbi:hypothetical protein C0J52_13489 [Blattella germanica]|nr:hypothetical protein C0J52_13489 [Blattella germanica]